MFTLEIGGRAVAVTNAGAEEAERIFGGEEFREDLMALETDEGPLWDGEAPLTVRPATDEEKAEFEQLEVEEEEEEEDEDGPVILFLVEVNDPEEDEEEE